MSLRDTFELWYATQPLDQYAKWNEDKQRYTIWTVKNAHWQTWKTAMGVAAAAAVLVIENRPVAKDLSIVAERLDCASEIREAISPPAASVEKQIC